jgi:hypothetical protein
VRYFHEEQRFGRWMWALVLVVGFLVVGVIVIVSLVAAVDRPGALPALLFAPAILILVFALLALARLDVDVDDRGVHIAFHYLWPPRHIPLENIKRAHATEYSPFAWGGWGVHYMFLRGWSFNAGGSKGVLVELNSGPSVVIGSQRAQELEAAIAKATAARAGG